MKKTDTIIITKKEFIMIKKIKLLAVVFGVVLMVAPVVNAATAITY